MSNNKTINMTQEKDLLLQDLCSRLPYGVKISIPDMWNTSKLNIEVLDEVFCGDDGKYRCNGSGMLIDYVKPYLFPLSSMTKEQLFDVRQILGNDWEIEIQYIHLLTADVVSTLSYLELQALFEWFNKHHFDYRGLIKKGLAINTQDYPNIYNDYDK